MAIPAFGIPIVQSDNRPTFIPDLKKYISLPIFNKMAENTSKTKTKTKNLQLEQL